MILNEFKNYSDADKQRDQESFMNIIEGIKNIYQSDRTFKKLWFKN